MGAPRRTMLLVDDEDLLRTCAADLLVEAGYHVIEAASADEALGVLQADPDAVHVLVTDVHMPGSMNGLGLATEVDRRWPQIALVVASGLAQYTDRDIPDHGRFVRKTWALPVMVQAIEGAGQ